MLPSHALVVGASSEIGTAIAVELATQGYELSLWGRDRQRLEAAAAMCPVTQAPPAVAQVDLTDAQLVERTIEEVADRGPLRAVVFAAGLFDWAPADEADPASWSRLFDVNLTSAAVLTRLVLPHLLAAAPSALIYIGSGPATASSPTTRRTWPASMASPDWLVRCSWMSETATSR